MNKIIRRYPSRDLLSSIQEDINRLMYPFEFRKELSEARGNDWPEIDIKEEENQLVVHADVPGVKKEDIDVSIQDGALVIKGHRESEKKEEKENYLRVERSKGSFMRSFSLPDSVDLENIKATTKNGVLEVILPKTKKSGSTKIDIKEE